MPRDGEVLVRTRMLSLDPANRAWMMGKTYRDALEPGQVMSGFAIGEVVESKAAGLNAGDIVEGDWGWQDYAAMPARRLTKRTTKAPLELLVGPLSITGLTAYFGLLEVGPAQARRHGAGVGGGRRGRHDGRPDRQARRLPRRRHGGRAGQVRLAGAGRSCVDLRGLVEPPFGFVGQLGDGRLAPKATIASTSGPSIERPP